MRTGLIMSLFSFSTIGLQIECFQIFEMFHRKSSLLKYDLIVLHSLSSSKSTDVNL